MSDEPFDLDAWISGAKAPERSVTVYGRGDLVARAEQLAAEITEVERSRDPGRLAGGATGALRRELAEVTAAFEESALRFTFRAPTRDEIKATADSLPKGATDDEESFAMLSLQVVSPQVTPAQWAAIRDRIGTGQFQVILDAANSAFGDGRLNIPFSLATSAAARTSSRS